MKVAIELTKNANNAPNRSVTYELVREDPPPDHIRSEDDHKLQSGIDFLAKVAAKIKTETHSLDSKSTIVLDIEIRTFELIATLQTPTDTV